MAELDYDALQRLADAATPRPWFQGRGNQRFENPREVYSKREPEEEDSHDIATFVWSDEDAEFIVASRSAIPALLDRVRELEAERDTLDAAFDRDLPWRYTEAVARAKTAEAERDAALSTIAKVREAVSGHPECDRYEDGDAITCGWKNAYASVVRAIEEAPEVES